MKILLKWVRTNSSETKEIQVEEDERKNQNNKEDCVCVNTKSIGIEFQTSTKKRNEIVKIPHECTLDFVISKR